MSVSIRLKTTLRTEKARKIIKTAEKQLLQARIKSINSILDNNAKPQADSEFSEASGALPPNSAASQATSSIGSQEAVQAGVTGAQLGLGHPKLPKGTTLLPRQVVLVPKEATLPPLIISEQIIPRVLPVKDPTLSGLFTCPANL